jgi:hypothetical protein
VGSVTPWAAGVVGKVTYHNALVGCSGTLWKKALGQPNKAVSVDVTFTATGNNHLSFNLSAEGPKGADWRLRRVTVSGGMNGPILDDTGCL